VRQIVATLKDTIYESFVAVIKRSNVILYRPFISKLPVTAKAAWLSVIVLREISLMQNDVVKEFLRDFKLTRNPEEILSAS
jgi:hypothetical protein